MDNYNEIKEKINNTRNILIQKKIKILSEYNEYKYILEEEYLNSFSVNDYLSNMYPALIISFLLVPRLEIFTFLNNEVIYSLLDLSLALISSSLIAIPITKHTQKKQLNKLKKEYPHINFNHLNNNELLNKMKELKEKIKQIDEDMAFINENYNCICILENNSRIYQNNYIENVYETGNKNLIKK